MISRAVILAMALVLAASSAGIPQARVAARFHHLHYRVADPGLWLRQAAASLDGTRAIVQGVGVGVRAGREYVLFERDSSEAKPRRRLEPSAAFAEAVRWLRDRGAMVSPDRLEDTNLARALPDEVFDHVGFAVDDLKGAVAAIGVKPAALTSEAARFRTRTGLVIELVRDTDRPDAFWCPMHPDVRSADQGKCPICAMSLVPIPPPRLGEYQMSVKLTPRVDGGASALDLAVHGPDGEPVSSFIEVHERAFHLFVISRDLSMFAHVHPDRGPDGTFRITHDLPPGQYVLLADFLPAEGTSQFVHKTIVTPGYRGPLFAPPPEIGSLPSEQVAGGLRIRMEAPLPVARRETIVRFHVTDEETGQSVTDLEPYLGASGHLLVVNPDVTLALHAHPEGNVSAGPTIAFGPVLPAPGRYKLWLQVQRKGTVITAPFAIEVRDVTAGSRVRF